MYIYIYYLVGVIVAKGVALELVQATLDNVDAVLWPKDDHIGFLGAQAAVANRCLSEWFREGGLIDELATVAVSAVGSLGHDNGRER